ncbi:MAG: LysR family transcriptional regulator [Clostridiales bacterium]|nr:LysR family transcriptional regulator [Clostridiales bacterium]
MLDNNTIKYLNDFITLADAGNYTKACDRLYLSKSTLAKHIKDLETSLGHKLFAASGHKLVLTDFGKFFRDYADRFVALDQEYEQARAAYDEDASSEVRVAVSPHMNCDHMMNMLWDHFVPWYPQYHLATVEYPAAILSMEDLFAMGYELVFGLSWSKAKSGCGCFPWAESTLIAVLPLTHTLAGREEIRLDELKGESFILPPRDTALHQMAVACCKEAGFEPHVNFTIQGNTNLVDLVAGNVGVSLSTANDLPADVYSDRAALVPLSPARPIYLNLYYRKDQALSISARTFFDYAKLIHRDHQKDIPYYGPEVGVENPFFK